MIQDPRFMGGHNDSIQIICTTRRLLRESREAGLFRDDLLLSHQCRRHFCAVSSGTARGHTFT